MKKYIVTIKYAMPLFSDEMVFADDEEKAKEAARMQFWNRQTQHDLITIEAATVANAK